MTKHGKRNTPEYEAWQHMKSRCFNPKSRAYKDYGGRGISVCEKWLVFENFYQDMGKKPHPKLSLERVENDLGYFPGNCKWATASEQISNRRPRTSLVYKGHSKTIKQWAEYCGISKGTMRHRLTVLRWPPEKAIETPLKDIRENLKSFKAQSGEQKLENK
jgi:hypothetical protein